MPYFIRETVVPKGHAEQSQDKPNSKFSSLDAEIPCMMMNGNHKALHNTQQLYDKNKCTLTCILKQSGSSSDCKKISPKGWCSANSHRSQSVSGRWCSPWSFYELFYIVLQYMHILWHSDPVLFPNWHLFTKLKVTVTLWPVIHPVILGLYEQDQQGLTMVVRMAPLWCPVALLHRQVELPTSPAIMIPLLLARFLCKKLSKYTGPGQGIGSRDCGA